MRVMEPGQERRVAAEAGLREARADKKAQPATTVAEPMEYEEHGRGLHMVKELSVRSGVKGDASGRTSWADVIWVVGPAPAPLQLMVSDITSAPQRTPAGQPPGAGPSMR